MDITSVENHFGGRAPLELVLQRIQDAELAQKQVPSSNYVKNGNYLRQNECASIIECSICPGSTRSRTLLDILVEGGLVETEKTGEKQAMRTRYRITEQGVSYCQARTKRVRKLCEGAGIQDSLEFGAFCSGLPSGMCTILMSLRYLDSPAIRSFLTYLKELPDEDARIKYFKCILGQAEKLAQREVLAWGESHIYHREANRLSVGIDPIFRKIETLLACPPKKRTDRQSEVVRLHGKKVSAERRAAKLRQSWTEEQLGVWTLVHGPIPDKLDELA